MATIGGFSPIYKIFVFWFSFHILKLLKTEQLIQPHTHKIPGNCQNNLYSFSFQPHPFNRYHYKIQPQHIQYQIDSFDPTPYNEIAKTVELKIQLWRITHKRHSSTCISHLST